MSRVRSHCLTCPQCGAMLNSAFEKSDDRPSAWRILIVHRPAGWEPESEFDAPADQAVVEAVEEPVGDASTFVRQYNAASLRAGGATWAVLAEGNAARRPDRVAKNFY